ncbi:SRPBCC family protein [Nocardia blacklockiae]|uniref:SRPBCC family protein n=1 Tax=Nocardia blacklockiae TaxID=480036 RepID=UPI0018930CBC|nr:SRPBCC family protein [Nocardia blacklockiae]MBF6170438.1 SRPBCC family protein [Nocardia blacklockiae]
MTEVELRIPVSAQAIFDVLADGWSYTNWVVGASHIRDVDDGWPAPGTRIHHSVGPWPFMVSDTTKVLTVDPPYALELEARLWPFGAATVRMELTEAEPGVTDVRMIEQATAGPGRFAPEPAQALLLRPRNKESLARLSSIARGTHRH